MKDDKFYEVLCAETSKVFEQVIRERHKAHIEFQRRLSAATATWPDFMRSGQFDIDGFAKELIKTAPHDRPHYETRIAIDCVIQEAKEVVDTGAKGTVLEYLLRERLH